MDAREDRGEGQGRTIEGTALDGGGNTWMK